MEEQGSLPSQPKSESKWYKVAIAFFGLLILVLIGLRVYETRCELGKKILTHHMRAYYNLLLGKGSVEEYVEEYLDVRVENKPDGTKRVHVKDLWPSNFEMCRPGFTVHKTYRALLDKFEEWLFSDPQILVSVRPESGEVQALAPDQLLDNDFLFKAVLELQPVAGTRPGSISPHLFMQRYREIMYLLGDEQIRVLNRTP
jgi:hypothetical protein